MIRKRVPKLLTILATAACIFGFVLVAPAATEKLPSISPLPTASAEVLPNGYDVNCTKVNDLQVLCTVAGCPRVNVEDDLAGDELHVHINGDAANGKEVKKACGDVYSETINIDAYKPFTYHVQGVRHHDVGSDDLTAYSVYQYNPPPKPVTEVQCPAGSKSPTVPQGQQCEAADVVCPAGSKSPTVPAGQSCALADKQCPPGALTATVPGDQQCAAPTNAVAMSITREGFNANVAITNNSALPAQCAYTATKQSGIGPGSVSRNLSVGPNSTGNITDLTFPGPFTTYNATVKCTADFDGKNVSIGEASQSVSG
jgi:hypothetical protein